MIRIPCKITLEGDKDRARDFIGAAQSQMRLLEKQLEFQNLKQGVRQVRLNSKTTVEARICFSLKEVLIYCKPRLRIGEGYGGAHGLYVYVTISDYVTIWNLSTGEVAADVYDGNGDALTFPCHKDKLKTWLSGVVDRPTRQVLKDNPEDNRDYLVNNHKDMGSENRVLLLTDANPSAGDYYGILSINQTDSNEVQNVYDVVFGHEGYDYCSPGSRLQIKEYDTPGPLSFSGGLDPATPCLKTFYYDYLYATNTECITNPYEKPGWGHYKFCLVADTVQDTANSLEYYFSRTKHLFLNPLPDKFYDPEGLGREITEYTIEDDSPYVNPVEITTHLLNFSHLRANERWHSNDGGENKIKVVHSDRRKYARNQNPIDLYSFATLLGPLVTEGIPQRILPRNYITAYSLIHPAASGNNLESGIRLDDCSRNSTKTITDDDFAFLSPLGDSANWDYDCDMKARFYAEDPGRDRLGVSWCGNTTPGEQTEDWYRVLLRYYINPDVRCLDTDSCKSYIDYSESDIRALPEEEEGTPISSVQATIELGNPGKYLKQNEVIGNSFRYKRPDGYDESPEDFSTIFGYPYREEGEAEDGDKCFPFDGSYDIYTLGEAVEDLINKHYKDGSDDQLLVYLYKKSYVTLKDKKTTN
jgi:hypothetical protein